MNPGKANSALSSHSETALSQEVCKNGQLKHSNIAGSRAHTANQQRLHTLPQLTQAAGQSVPTRWIFQAKIEQPTFSQESVMPSKKSDNLGGKWQQVQNLTATFKTLQAAGIK
jgi:hypothetical protein